jgi:hypothetical protein
MLNTIIRGYFYIIAGVTSALIGWNLGQVLLHDLKILPQMPEIILFPCVAVSLAFGMIINEILISNPTRLTLCLRKMWLPLLIALGVGCILGLIAGAIAQILFLPQLQTDSKIIRILGWLIIGISVGLSEGISWSWQSIEAGNKKRFWQRFSTGMIGASLASIIAAFIFESIRELYQGSDPQALTSFRNIEDPLGFSILGLLLGIAFTITNSPSYLAALRAGCGFEFTGDREDNKEDEEDDGEDTQTTKLSVNYPRIETPILKMIPETGTIIEEGLSIQLPGHGKINIGSEENPKSQIRLPGVDRHLGNLILKGRRATLEPNVKAYRNIAINGEMLVSSEQKELKHNDVLTFYTKKDHDQEKIYRFVYYNRFLDPQG